MSMFEHFRDVYGHHDVPDRPVPGLAAYAAGLGWQERPDDPANGLPFDGNVRDRIHQVVKYRAGAQNSRVGAGPTRFHDAYAGTFSGRQFVVGNAWTGVGYMSVVSVCALQLTGRSFLPLLQVEPRAHGLMAALFDSQSRAVPVSPAFDEHYAVYAHPAEAAQGLLTPRVQELMLSRTDWRFWTLTTALVCMADIVYASPADVAGFLAQMTAIAEAMPVAALPTVDELIPGLPPELSFAQTAFTGGKIDRDGMMRQFESLPPEQQAQAIAAFQQMKERRDAERAARRDERRRHR